MSLLDLPDRTIDASHGNPLFPFDSLWRHALAHSSHHLTPYNQNTHNPLYSKRYRNSLMPIHDYFNARGFKRKDWSGLGLDCFMMTDGGTTRAFDMVMKLLVDDVAAWNKTKPATPVRPVILMPTPTYGHFLRQLKTSDSFKDNIECVSIPRQPDKNWTLNIEDLRTTLINLTKQGKRVVAYFDSNPHNPTGYVRGEAETKAIGEILTSFSDFYQELDRREADTGPRNGDLFEDRLSLIDLLLLHPKGPERWSGHASRIRIIDDMVYDGLQYKGIEAPCAFAQVMPDQKDCITLAGPSKNGLAALRAGLIIANTETISDLRKIDEQASYCPSEVTMSILTNYFNDAAENTRLRTQYQRKASDYYKYAGLFLKAMINGTDTMGSEISPAYHIQKMRQDVVAATHMNPREVTAFLNKGIAGIRIVTSPQAGFFHLLDTSRLKGSTYKDDKTFKDEWDFATLSRKHDLALASGDYTGADANDCLHRITFAMQPRDLVKLALRLKAVAAECTPQL